MTETASSPGVESKDRAKSAPGARPHPHLWALDTPSVDDVELSDLYDLEEIPVETEDGWQLVLTRYAPRPQAFAQPLLGAPLVLVHGYTQNRRAWNTGQFVKTMLYFGADVYLLELRGHGKSGVDAQRRLARKNGRPLPDDIDYGWDLDSYLLYDLPAAISAIKERTGWERIFYCGHSLGGILGYAYATLFDDLMGLITIGSPSDFARTPLWMRLSGWAPLFAFPAIDLALSTTNLARFLARSAGRASGLYQPTDSFEPLKFKRLPFRAGFQWIESNLRRPRMQAPFTGSIPFTRPLMYKPRNVALGALRPLLREGSNDEPRATVEQFARWLRRGRIVSQRIRHDVAAAFPRIRIPLAIFFGDEDPFASVRTTRNVYRAASSDYLLWRPVRGNSHLDLTMGHDIRQICYDVKNLMTYALDHQTPRARRARRRNRSA
jgi:pimeloyl-ACP methyl ester carboxylesterase